MATPNLQLQPPSELKALAISDYEVGLLWVRNSIGDTNYSIERKEGNGEFVRVEIVLGKSASWIDTGVYPSTTYTYRIRCGNKQGNSLPSNEVSVTTYPGTSKLVNITNIALSAIDPYSVIISCINNNSPTLNQLGTECQRSLDGVKWVNVFNSLFDTVPYTDTNLFPGSTYQYRFRARAYANWGKWVVQSVTTPPEMVGVPKQAVDLSAKVEAYNRVVLSWTDKNNGTATYRVERAQFSYNNKLGWVTVGASNTNSFVDESTLEEFFYQYRVIATNSVGESGPTPILKVRTASKGTGTIQEVHIGPGQDYEKLGDFYWDSLGPGDTVYIHPGTYHEKILITNRGTEDKPIRIIGIEDADGNKPIISGNNAITDGQFSSSYLPLQDYWLIGIGTHTASTGFGFAPGYIYIQNLDIQGANGTIRYRDYQGSTRTYMRDASGIYLYRADHVIIKGCNIHDNGNGIFGANSGDDHYVGYIRLEYNHIYDNGVIGSYLQHNSYIEADHCVYEYNRYDSPREGSLGNTLKDRSIRTTIRYNWLGPGGHILDLVDSQNQAGVAFHDAGKYRKTLVYGNVLFNDGSRNTVFHVHYGGDSGDPPADRRGILYFYNNTLVMTADKSKNWYGVIFQITSNGCSIDARNNIFWFNAATPPDMYLTDGQGIIHQENNWVSPNWSVGPVSIPFRGLFSTLDPFLTNSQNDPGLDTQFKLEPGSICIGPGVPTPVYPCDREYVEPHNGRNRLTSLNLGAFE